MPAKDPNTPRPQVILADFSPVVNVGAIAVSARQVLSCTDAEGKVLRGGSHSGTPACGPYLQRMAANPFVAGPRADKVGGGSSPVPGDGATGWYFNTTTHTFSPNDKAHRGL